MQLEWPLLGSSLELAVRPLLGSLLELAFEFTSSCTPAASFLTLSLLDGFGAKTLSAGVLLMGASRAWVLLTPLSSDLRSTGDGALK